MWIGHRKEIRKLTFRALALSRSESIRSDEGLTLETSAFESLYGGQFTLSTQLSDKTKLSRYTPTDAAPQFLKKLTPLSPWGRSKKRSWDERDYFFLPDPAYPAAAFSIVPTDRVSNGLNGTILKF